MEYKVVCESNLTVFESEVSALMADGWQLQGGVCVVDKQHGGHSTETRYYQALVKDLSLDLFS